jgi:hypothetical protein
MLSVIVDGKVLDFRYTKVSAGIYNFHIGDIHMGQLFRMGNMNWSAVVGRPRTGISPIDGFRSRYKASEYMLKARGFNIPESTESPESGSECCDSSFHCPECEGHWFGAGNLEAPQAEWTVACHNEYGACGWRGRYLDHVAQTGAFSQAGESGW